MRYLYGPESEIRAIRAAVDALAGMPYYTEGFPSPPGNPDEYQPGAPGWMEHVLEEPLIIGDGTALLRAPDDILPYVGQTIDVNGSPVTVPTEAQLMYRADLPPSVQAWLDQYENPTAI